MLLVKHDPGLPYDQGRWVIPGERYTLGEIGPLGPLDPFPKGFSFLRLHLLFPPEHGLRPAGRVHHPTLK